MSGFWTWAAARAGRERARVWVRCIAAVFVCDDDLEMGLEDDGGMLVEVGKGEG